MPQKVENRFNASRTVIRAEAGIQQFPNPWIPARASTKADQLRAEALARSAGMTPQI
jgi:hypothetical protein